jgi:hypothetical protein
MRRMSLMAGLAASAGMMAAMTPVYHGVDAARRDERPADEKEKTGRQRKRWLQRQARKKTRLNK